MHKSLGAMGIQGLLGEAADGGEDVVGRPCPDERLWIGVTRVEVLPNRAIKVLHRLEGAATDPLLGEIGKEAFDLVQSRTGRWCEVHVKARRFANQRRTISDL